jgi:hypothetical protein
MRYPIKFYLASGEQNPNESELQQKPLAQLITECIERCYWFSEKTVEVRFWYSADNPAGEFLLSVSWDHVDIPEDCLSSFEVHICGVGVLESAFESMSVPDELREELSTAIATFGENVKYSIESGS